MLLVFSVEEPDRRWKPTAHSFHQSFLPMVGAKWKHDHSDVGLYRRWLPLWSSISYRCLQWWGDQYFWWSGWCQPQKKVENSENRSTYKLICILNLLCNSMWSWLTIQMFVVVPPYSLRALIPLVLRTASNSSLNLYLMICDREFYWFAVCWEKKILIVSVWNGLPVILRLQPWSCNPQPMGASFLQLICPVPSEYCRLWWGLLSSFQTDVNASLIEQNMKCWSKFKICSRFLQL